MQGESNERGKVSGNWMIFKGKIQDQGAVGQVDR
jgi:hypothetical protein